MGIVKADIEGTTVYIFEMDGVYYPAGDYVNAFLKIVSPSLFHIFDQTTLKNAYETGEKTTKEK